MDEERECLLGKQMREDVDKEKNNRCSDIELEHINRVASAISSRCITDDERVVSNISGHSGNVGQHVGSTL
jgi:hypothetical protein